jgi:23S rRNA-/tRNA-specific pseudouridylate synthase
LVLNFNSINFRTMQAAEFLLAMFKKRQVIKHYWVITKGIPNPSEGIYISHLLSLNLGGRLKAAYSCKTEFIIEYGSVFNANSNAVSENI